MIKDGFYEESAGSANSRTEARIYTAFKIFAFAFWAVGVGLGLLFSFQLIANVTSAEGLTTAQRVIPIVMWFGMLLLLIGLGVLCWFWKNRYNVSYDYTFVEDEIRITKVFNGRKRKYLTTLKSDRILQIGWVGSDAYQNALRGLQGKKPVRCTPNKEASEGKEMIYFVQSTTMEKQMYILECRRQLLENIVFTAGRNKLERR